MNAYTAQFVKKDGSVRQMNFVKIDQLPEHFLESRIKGSTIKKNLNPNHFLVWDIDKKDFRFIDSSSIIGDVKVIEVDEKEIT